ncbi:MAG TPA: hypothetical protein PK250_12705 [Syntrophobacter fumaroxidans]|nr:hypothetical protein [Syntrophobacter fumaroxidans]
MAISIYRSTDPSAPTLANTAGALIAILDACLVNGYGSKAALGWTKEFSGTNLATYRAAVGNRLYLGIDDTGTNSARARAFSVATAAGVAVGSGTNPFPTDAQLSGGMYFNKAAGSNYPWVLVSNGRIFYLYVDYSNNGNAGVVSCFGDFVSYKTSDENGTVLIGSNGSTNSSAQFQNFKNATNAVVPAHYLSQRYDGAAYSIACGKTPMSGLTAAAENMMSNTANYPLYPDPLLGSMFLTPFYVTEPDTTGTYGVIRGRLPGIWAACHRYAPFTTGDVVSGDASSNANGKTFEVFRIYNSCVLIETSDTWDAINFR